MELHEPRILRPITRQSILCVNRQFTNKIFGIIFIASFLLWIAVVIYAICGPVKSTSTNFFNIDELDTVRIYIALGYILLCAVFTFIIFMALRWIPDITNIVLWTFWILVLVYVALAVYQTTFLSVYTAIGSVLSYSLIIVLLNAEWFHLSEKVLKEACKMMLSVPSTFVFSLFVCLLNALLIAIITLVTEKLISSDRTLLPILLLVANCVFGVWTVVAVAALGLMTMSGTFAEYYWAKDKTTVSFCTVLRLFAVNCRYHIGTAAMFHPLLGGLIAFYYQAALAVFAIVEGASIYEICFFAYNIFDMLVLRIAILGAAARCGIQGENFQKSMTRAMTLLSNASRTLTVIKVMESLLELSTLIIVVLTAYSTLGYLSSTLPSNSKDSWQQLFSVLVMLGGTVVTVTFLTCITAACYSVMLCLHEELEHFGDRVPQDACACMSPELHSALNHGGPPNWFRNSCGRCVPDFEYDADD